MPRGKHTTTKEAANVKQTFVRYAADTSVSLPTVSYNFNALENAVEWV